MNKALSILKGNHLRGDLLLSTVSGVATTKSELVELFDKKIPAIDIITTKEATQYTVVLTIVPVVIALGSGIFVLVRRKNR